MQIRSYDEVDPYEVYKIGMIGFGWPLTPEYVRHALREDPRVLDGFAIYAMEREKPIAQVVPLEMPVRLTSGVETVGGIAGVCSHPSVWGKGYAWRLMERAHERYRELGLSISTLTTSPNIRGHGIYRRMGYVDLAPFYRGGRSLPAKRDRPKGIKSRSATRKDLSSIHSFYKRHTRGLTGWVMRDSRLLPMRVARDHDTLKAYRIVERDGEPVGYLRASRGGNLLASEIILPRMSDFRGAIQALESEDRRSLVSLGAVTSRRDQDRYRAVGYDLYGPTLAAVMAMPLDRRFRPRDLPQLFGAGEGRFVLYPTDHF